MQSIFWKFIRRFFEKTRYCDCFATNKTSKARVPIQGFSSSLLNSSKDTYAPWLTEVFTAVCCKRKEETVEK